MAALSLLVVAPVLAEPTASDIATARALVVDGRKARADGDFKKAIEKLGAAWSLYRTPVTGHELALAYRAAGQLVEAREMALTVVKMAVEKDEGKASATARSESATMSDELANRLARVELVVLGVPDGTTYTVTLDGQTVPSAALSATRFVNPGKHAAIVTIAGGAEKTVEFEVKEGESKKVDIAMPAVEKKDPPPPEPAKVVSTPTPTAAPAPAPAKSPDTARTSTGWLTYTGFGVAAVGVVIGSITGVSAISITNKLSAECGSDHKCPESERSRIDSQETQATISTVSFVVAGVGLAVGVVDLVTGATSTKTTASATMSVAVGPGSLGLVGSF